MGAVLRSLLACSFCSLMRGERGGGGSSAGGEVKVAGLVARGHVWACGRGEAWLPVGRGARRGGSALARPPPRASPAPEQLPRRPEPRLGAARPASGHRPLLSPPHCCFQVCFTFLFIDFQSPPNQHTHPHLSAPPERAARSSRPIGVRLIPLLLSPGSPPFPPRAGVLSRGVFVGGERGVSPIHRGGTWKVFSLHGCFH